jgi:hypothetical protein
MRIFSSILFLSAGVFGLLLNLEGASQRLVPQFDPQRLTRTYYVPKPISQSTESFAFFVEHLKPIQALVVSGTATITIEPEAVVLTELGSGFITIKLISGVSEIKVSMYVGSSLESNGATVKIPDSLECINSWLDGICLEY